MLGIDSVTPEGGGGGGDGCGSGSENGLRLVGGEVTSSPFAMRIRCLCHGMLLPVRAHALRAMNMAYGKNEKVPLVSLSNWIKVLRRRRVPRVVYLPTRWDELSRNRTIGKAKM